MFETISNTDANFLNLHIDKATKTRGDKQLYLITHFTKQTLNLNYLLLKLNVTEQVLKNPKQKRPFFLNSRSMMETSCFGSLSTLLYTSDPKWHNDKILAERALMRHNFFCSVVFCLLFDQFTCCVLVTTSHVNNLFPDFRCYILFSLDS